MSGIRHAFATNGTAIYLFYLVSLGGCSDGTDPVDQSMRPAPGPEIVSSLPLAATGENEADADVASDVTPVALQPDASHPFPNRIPAPAFPGDVEWLNTGGTLRLADLKGKFVLLDFWTYCCINCMHILPELKKLEQAYPKELVVIGVHSAKFETEQESKNIAEAVLRHDIEHPVINDREMRIWRSYRVNSWPSIRLIDPQGKLVAQLSGEFKFEQIDAALKKVIPYYRRRKLLDETPLRFDLLADKQPRTPLRFPGKVLADAAGDRLFIADSSHNRIVICTTSGRLLDTIGTGQPERKDGDYSDAGFHHPQGLALKGEYLYVADTDNHLLRRVNLAEKRVETLAGTGEQSPWPWPGVRSGSMQGKVPARPRGKARSTALNSPWDLLLDDDRLFVAMAGCHQIWQMELSEGTLGPYAGNGREDIVDGTLLPDHPYGSASYGKPPSSAFAQPSGLATDGRQLFVADSEGSSIRVLPMAGRGNVATLVGTSHLPQGRLFTFGDRDGPREQVLLQHAIGVACRGQQIYVADTYNNKIKVVDASTGAARTLAGTGAPGAADKPAAFDEPAGLSLAGSTLYVADTNNHLVRTIDVESGSVKTLTIQGLNAPSPVDRSRSEDPFAGMPTTKMPASRARLENGRLTIQVSLQLPAGWKINSAAPMEYRAEIEPLSADTVDRKSRPENSWKKVTPPTADFEFVELALKPGDYRLNLGLNYYYCAEGAEGLCKAGQRLFIVPLKLTDEPQAPPLSIEYRIPR